MALSPQRMGTAVEQLAPSRREAATVRAQNIEQELSESFQRGLAQLLPTLLASASLLLSLGAVRLHNAFSKQVAHQVALLPQQRP
jgi:hypothetical protein